MLGILDVMSIFYETVKEACVEAYIDADFCEVAMAGVESDDVAVDYGSFTDESFKNRYDVFERLPDGMAPNGIYDPAMKTVLLNSDVLKKGSIIYDFKRAIIHEMRHYYQHMTGFKGRLVDAEVDATIVEHVYGMREFEFQNDEEYLYEQYVAGEIEKDLLLAAWDIYLTKRLGVDPSPEYLYWLSSKLYMPSYEAEIVAWYQLNGDAGISSRRMEFEETYINSRIMGELFADLNRAAKIEPYSGTRSEFEDYFKNELWPAYYKAFETMPFETDTL